MPTLPEMIQALSHTSGVYRQQAICDLAELGSDACEAVPHLIELLLDRDGHHECFGGTVAGAAACALLKIAPESAHSLLWNSIIASSNAGNGLWEDLLRGVAWAEEDGVPVLAAALLHGPREVRIEAAVIIEIHAEERLPLAKAVPALMEGLRDHETEVRRPIARALRHIGPPARSAIPILMRSLRASTAHDIRCEVLEALPTIGAEPAAVVPEIIRILEQHPSDNLLCVALQTLGNIGVEARAAEALVRRVEKHSSKDVRLLAAETLRCIRGRKNCD